MNKLYICEYPYIMYKTLIERMGDEENPYSLILSDPLADMKPLVSVLKRSGLFERVEFFPSELYRDYYDLSRSSLPASHIKNRFSLLKKYFILALRQKEFKEVAFPFDLDFKQYDKIVCSDMVSVINGYLSRNHMEYALSEHAKDIHRQGNPSMATVAYFAVFSLLDAMHIITGLQSASRFCKEMIVNDATKPVCYIRHKKVTEWNVDKHIEALDARQKDRIFQIYAEAYGLKIDVGQTYDLLLTTPLCLDGYLPSEESQVKFYKDIIRDHFNYPVLIKPHPRDTVDYKKLFPECIVIDKNIPSEVLNFSQNLRLGTALTLASTSSSSFGKKAEKLITLEDTFAPASQMESLKAYR